MPDRSSSPHYRVFIDRVVVDGVPDDVQPEAFRREVVAEMERLLAELGGAEGVRTGRSQERVVHETEEGIGADPTQVARHIVSTLQK